MAKQETRKPRKKTEPFHWLYMLLLVTAIQIISGGTVLTQIEEAQTEVLFVFGGFLAVEWLYFIFARNLAHQRTTELEIIAFLLSGFGLVTVASVYPHYALKQFVAILIGLAAFVILLALMRNVEVVNALHIPVAVGCVGLL
ncbi:MAG: hypothetical protein IKH12_00030, partial [Clostridia bacterium]|nr:hypothetical protein [Clostridia bacterium]